MLLPKLLPGNVWIHRHRVVSDPQQSSRPVRQLPGHPLRLSRNAAVAAASVVTAYRRRLRPLHALSQCGHRARTTHLRVGVPALCRRPGGQILPHIQPARSTNGCVPADWRRNRRTAARRGLHRHHRPPAAPQPDAGLLDQRRGRGSGLLRRRIAQPVPLYRFSTIFPSPRCTTALSD